MTQIVISDFSRVVIFPKDPIYKGELNVLHKNIIKERSVYNIDDYFYFNEELLDFYKSLKGRYKVVMFTSGVLQEHPQVKEKLQGIFDEIFSSQYLNLPKTKPVSYTTICQKLNIVVENAVFIDDSNQNINAANKAGLQTVLYVDNQEAIEAIRKLL